MRNNPRNRKFGIVRFSKWVLGGTLLVLAILFDGLLPSCASISAPSGGPRDTAAPVLDTAYPYNGKTNFSSREIRLIFNEYINLTGARQQILISPPLDEDLEVLSKNRSVSIILPDSLEQNTTYIISFGNSITDFTEGNEVTNLKYVFSTGDYLDSLEIKGSIKRAYNGDIPPKMLVGLYRRSAIEDPDSFLYKQLPNYFALSDENGFFQITNMKAGEYILVAFEDQISNFKLGTGNELQAFWPSPVILQPDSNYQYELRAFKPEPEFRFRRASQKSRGKILFAFAKPPHPDSLQIEALSIPADSSWWEKLDDGDSLYYWFRQKPEQDTALFKLNGYGFKDSIYPVFLRDIDPDRLKVELAETEIRKQDTLFLESTLPLASITRDSVFILQKDTGIAPLQLHPHKRKQAFLAPPHKGPFQLRLRPGALEDWFGQPSDSALHQIKVFGREDLGTVNFKVYTDSIFAYVLNIYPEGELEKPLLQRFFEDSTTVRLRNFAPGKFDLFLIQDVNRDSTWTTGSREENRLPEARIKYQEPLEIRANWETDLEWRVTTPKD